MVGNVVLPLTPCNKTRQPTQSRYHNMLARPDGYPIDPPSSVSPALVISFQACSRHLPCIFVAGGIPKTFPKLRLGNSSLREGSPTGADFVRGDKNSPVFTRQSPICFLPGTVFLGFLVHPNIHQSSSPALHQTRPQSLAGTIFSCVAYPFSPSFLLYTSVTFLILAL